MNSILAILAQCLLLLLLFRLIQRRCSTRLAARIALVCFALYAVTWFPGRADLRCRLHAQVNRWHAGRVEVSPRDAYDTPSFRLHWAYPLLPGIMLCRYEYCIGPLFGEGGYFVYLWFGTGTVKLFSPFVWVS